jgi:hypothetical protein
MRRGEYRQAAGDAEPEIEGPLRGRGSIAARVFLLLRDLRAAKAINARSEKLNSRSAQWPLPPLQRVPMLASPRGDLHSRSSWPKSDQKMVPAVARQALNADYRMQFDECHSSDWL